MKIAMTNFKGGVGKSLIAHQLITCFGYSGITHDPYGNLANRLPDRVTNISDIKSLADLPEKVVFDCGGFDDKILRQIIKISDLIIIPFTDSFEAIQSTVQMLVFFKEILAGKKILFIANMALKNSPYIAQATKAFKKVLNIDINVFTIPTWQSFRTAINRNIALTDMSKKSIGYKKAADCMLSLHECILNIK